MSIIDPSVDGPVVSPEKMAAPALPRRGGGPWAWAVIACVLLAGSGAVRAMQDRRHKDERNYVEACPIALATIPTKLGVWRLVDGGERKLDDLTMRITGSSQHIMRTYADDLTGVTMTVLVLFGPAEPVLPHTPEVCYPSSGFSKVDGPSDSTIKFSPGGDAEGRPAVEEARFRSGVYQKSAGRLTFREAVYYSFRLDGRWSPDVGAGRKFPRRNPGIFKIQVQRPVVEGESLGKGDPMEQFLSALLAEIEGEIKRAEGKTVATRSS